MPGKREYPLSALHRLQDFHFFDIAPPAANNESLFTIILARENPNIYTPNCNASSNDQRPFIPGNYAN